METLNNKRILISGGTTGLGKATALLLAQRGAKLFIFGRRHSELVDTLDAIRDAGGRAWGRTADVSDYSAVHEVFRDAGERLGGIDALINNAAMPANNIFNTPPEQWGNILNVNLLGYLHCAKLASEMMRGSGGKIINIGSLCVDVLDKGCDIYVASKLGVAGFSASLRKEVAEWGITVTLINPGQMATEMVSENPEQKAQAISEGKMLVPADVAEVICFCLSQPPHVAITELNVRPNAQLEL